MLISKEIAGIINSVETPSKNIVAGTNLNPELIFLVSTAFPEINLASEELLLLLLNDKREIRSVLTNRFLYVVNSNRISLKSETLQWVEQHSFFTTEEKSILIKVLNLLFNKETKMLNTLDSFIEKYKNLVKEQESNFENKDLYFDGKYIEMLRHEAEEALHFCNQLNEDENFIQSLNLIFSSTSDLAEKYKAEHLMIADITKAFNLLGENLGEKAKFTLAFYFEKLQGNDLSKGISIKRLNEMPGKQSFNENIEKIRQASFFQTADFYKDEFLIPSVLFRLNHQDFTKSGNIIYRFASIIAKADGQVDEKEKLALQKILDKTTQPKVNKTAPTASVKEVAPDDNLEVVMKELNDLIGLDEIKKNVLDLVNFYKVQQLRKEKGINTIDSSFHMVFLGPPGTGKTTVARLIGRIFKHLGYLKSGHLVETDRFGMVAGFVGQTAIKVDTIVNQSLGGVLFIDEAYSLNQEDMGRDFGAEAIDTLVKRMEDHRNEFLVIAAGYTEPMKAFVESNPGLRSRFNRYFLFDHFYPNQLMQIFESFSSKSDFILTAESKDKLMDLFDMIYEKRDDGFGNARTVRNIFEQCVQKQANRIISLKDVSKDILQTLQESDIPEPKEILKKTYFPVNE